MTDGKEKTEKKAQLLTEKYSPNSLDEMIGNDEAREAVNKWILNWISGHKRRPILLHGAPGIGKTSIAYALMRQHDLELIEMNASELRDKERVERVISGAASFGTLSGKTRLVLIDDVDIFIGRKDSGGIGAIIKIMKDANCPIMLTANDIWDKKLAPLRPECEIIELKKVSRGSIGKLLLKIAKKEGINLSEDEITKIAENSGGDARAALNDLQGRKPSVRDRNVDMFSRVRAVFKSTTYKDAREALSGDADYNLLKLWIDENIANEYEKPDDVARAYYWLSRADLFQGRIESGSWVLLKYALDLMTAGVALAKEQPYRKFTKYMFPSYLRSMSMTSQRRSMMKNIGLKVGKLVHTNYRDASEYFQLLAGMEASVLEDFYCLDEDEIKFLKTFSK